MKRISKIILFVLVIGLLTSNFFIEKDTKADVLHNGIDHYSIINEDGSIEQFTYDEKVSSVYNLNVSNKESVKYNLSKVDSIKYGVARILGYVSYKEYDGTNKTQRSGYTHGSAANDAAFIGVLNKGKTVRVKQAGVYMDIPAENVIVTSYTSNSQVSYYLSDNGMLYHYYYYGDYNKSSRSRTLVGYTPSYLKNGVKYYSYDGHYFYTNYVTMLSDYKSGVNVYKNAVNKSSPYYNYYQYLSLRTPSKFSASQYNSYITNETKQRNIKSVLNNIGSTIVNNDKTYGVNSSLLLGIAINETGWGSSKYATTRYNLFGINAKDSNSDDAYKFKSVKDCIQYFTKTTMNDLYLDCREWRYRGAHLGDKQSGINVYYASDPYWGEKAASYSYFLNNLNKKVDYLKYDVVISTKGNVVFYKDKNFKKGIYSSGVQLNSKEIASNTNYYTYNIPFTVLSEGKNYYKIYSDTTLAKSRNVKDGGTKAFDVSRDYVYVTKEDVKLIHKNNAVTVYLKGDVNGDKKVTSLDYVLIRNHINKTKLLTGNALRRSDVNKDGKVSSLDYVLVMNHLNGKKKLF